jgi:hypothetical protein
MINISMLFFFNCEKCKQFEMEFHEGNETKKLIEIEDNCEVEMISALDKLRKEREENKSLNK